MFEATKDLILKILGSLIPKLFGLAYKADWISEKIKLRPRTEGEAITFNCSELPTIQIWIQATNLSPFTIEIDRLLVQVQYGGHIGEFVALRRTSVMPVAEALIRIDGSLTEKQVTYLRAIKNTSYATLYLTAFINCAVHDLEITRSLQTTNLRLI